jgi:CheY-like chemotaxis protein
MIDLNRAYKREKQTILIVDDTRLMRHLISRFVESVGFTALQAENGRDAWQLVLQYVPDLIITDIEMPVLDGLQLIQHIRNSTDLRVQPIPIFVCSSVPSELLYGGAPLLVEHVLSKPLNLEKLRTCLREVTQDHDELT